MKRIIKVNCPPYPIILKEGIKANNNISVKTDFTDNNKYINNNYKSYQGKKSGYQGRIYPPGFLNKLYANYNSPNDSVEDYKKAKGITNLDDLIENND